MRIQLPSKPKEIIVRDNVKQPLPDFKNSWDEVSHTCLLEFENSSEVVGVEIRW
jgi:hypothetical protein